MKAIIIYFALFLSTGLIAQSPSASEGVYASANDETHQVLLLVDGYAALTTYEDAHYISTTGGPYSFHNNQLTIQTEFNDADPQSIGSEMTLTFTPDNDNMIDAAGLSWIKQKTIKSKLDGAWKIAGRYSEEKYQEIGHSGSRKTLKLLKDGHFQWIAIDPDAQKFYGTGGGTYQFTDGLYSEHILFFSRDNNRVGASLEFEGEVMDGDWHHRGYSSKGDSLHEVWTRIE